MCTTAYHNSLASEIGGLVESCERPDDMTAVIGSVLHGYLLLRSGHVRDAIAMSECVAETVADNPLILQFPLTWTMSCCVLEGQFNQKKCCSDQHCYLCHWCCQC
jgi:hypothetical protein